MNDPRFVPEYSDDELYGHPGIPEDGGCDHCGEPIGICWIGGNPDGTDAEEFFPYWIHGRRLLCPSCHEAETAPIPERVVLPPEDWQPQVGGWIIVHTRATDRVYFGPFATLHEADAWMNEVGRRRGVSGSLVPLVSPASNPDNLWQDPIRDFQIVTKDPA